MGLKVFHLDQTVPWSADSVVGIWKPKGALALHVDSPAGMLALYSALRAILVCFTEVSVAPCPVSIVSFWWSHLHSVALFLCPLSISILIALVLTFIFLLPSKSPCSGPNGLPASVLFPPDLCPHCSHCSSVKSRCHCLSFTSPYGLTRQDQTHWDMLSPASRQLFMLLLPSTPFPAHFLPLLPHFSG